MSTTIDRPLVKPDVRWLMRAYYESTKSPDPNTRVGAVIVNPDGWIIAWGHNNLPDGMTQTHERLHNREIKLPIIVHAEMNALMSATRCGKATAGCTLYVAATDDTGPAWGGSPCRNCTKHIIQAGIRRVVSLPMKQGPSKWRADLEEGKSWLLEAGLIFDEIRL